MKRAFVIKQLTACLAIWMVMVMPCALQADGFAQKRLVKYFDFEEAAQGNFEDLPMHWYRIGVEANTGDANFKRQPLHQQLAKRPGYPSYTQVRFDKPQSKAGNHHLYLGLNGGNAGAFLEIGALPAVPNSDYRVVAKVRIQNLDLAVARISAYFVNARGEMITRSLVYFDVMQSQGQWVKVSLKLSGDYADAAWIGLEVELLQPTFNSQLALGKHQVVRTEVHGEAWFDDISIWQLPNVKLSSQSVVNIIQSPKKPKLTINIKDLTGRPLITQLTIYNHQLEAVASERRQVGDGLPSSWTWEPNLPKFGWYLADLLIYELDSEPRLSDTPPIARKANAFLWLAPETRSMAQDLRHFTVSAAGVDKSELALVVPLVMQSGLASVVVSPWTRQLSFENLELYQNKLEKLLHPLVAAGRQVIFSLSPLPRDLGHSIDTDDLGVLEMFSDPKKRWIDWFKPVALRHGQRVRYWLIGSPDDLRGFNYPNLSQLSQTIHDDLNSQTPDPKVYMPWGLNQQRAFDIQGVSKYLLDVPTSIAPRYLQSYLTEWKQSPSSVFSLHLRTIPADEISQQSRIEDLALRMIYAWQADSTGLMLTRPWTVSNQREKSLVPDPLLGVFIAVARRLAGRKIRTRLDLGKGIQCFIFEGVNGGMLAAWQEGMPGPSNQVALYLGPHPVEIDVWGNRKKLALVNGQHHLTLSRTPIFIEGIDLNLAILRASFKLDNPFIESRQVPHHREMVLHNPWPRTINGSITLTNLQRWRIKPRRHFFSIASGETYRIPIQLAIPVSEVAGDKKLVANINFMADKRYQVKFEAPMVVGLKYLKFDANLTLNTDPKTGKIMAVVTVMVTNRGDKKLSLYCFAHMKNYPRAERTISSLVPGQTVVRLFRFPDAGKALSENANIRVGVRETRGPAVLNKLLSPKELAGE